MGLVIKIMIFSQVNGPGDVDGDQQRHLRHQHSQLGQP